MQQEYIGQNIKVGSMYMFIPSSRMMLTGEAIYVANSEGLYEGIGEMDNAVWIQSLPGLENENAALFIRGVELVDKYAPDGKRDACFKSLSYLANAQIKTGHKYCKNLNFFFDLGRWNGQGKPLDHIRNTMRKYRNFLA